MRMVEKWAGFLILKDFWDKYRLLFPTRIPYFIYTIIPLLP